MDDDVDRVDEEDDIVEFILRFGNDEQGPGAEELRARALGRLLDDLAALRARLTEPGRPHLRVGADQYATVLQDMDVLSMISDLATVHREISGYDLADSAEVGGPLRQRLVRAVADARRLVDAVEEVSWFAPPEEVAEVRQHVIDAGTQALDLLSALVGMLCAPTPEAARAQQETLDATLCNSRIGENFSGLVDRYPALGSVDTNARIARAFSLSPGEFVDEDGIASTERILAAFASEPEPLLALSQRAGEYLGHLLPADTTLGPGAAGLMLPAIMLAGLDRPLRAHRIARELAGVASRAYDNDSSGFAGLVTRNLDAMPNALAAGQRVLRDIRYIEAGHAVDDDDVASRLITSYRRISEASYRPSAWLALNIMLMAAGTSPSGGDAPMLAELQDRLSGQGLVGGEIATACDRALRNAEAHEQYGVDDTGEFIVDHKLGHRWRVDNLEIAFDQLVGAIYAVEAAIGALLIRDDVEIPIPEWLSHPQVAEMQRGLLRLTLAARGLTVTEFTDDEILVEQEGELTYERCLTGLVMQSRFTDRDPLRIRSTTTGEVFEVDQWAVQEAIDAPPGVADLAAVIPMFSSFLRGGAEPAGAHAACLWLQAAALANGALEGGIDFADSDSLRLLARRIAQIQRFIRKWSPQPEPDLSRNMLEALDQLRQTTLEARAEGDGSVVVMLLEALRTDARAVLESAEQENE